MSIQKITHDKQKLIITGLIVSDEFIKEIIPILNYNKSLSHEIFSNYYNIVLKWCANYYNKYQKAPKAHIQTIYEESFEKAEYDDKDYQFISNFLKNLSDNYEREKNFNERYIIDQALLYLRKSNLTILKKQISSTEDVDEAEQYVEDFRHIKKETNTIDNFDLFTNVDKEVDEIFNQEDKDYLFKLPSALGEYIYYFQRSDLIAFTAAAKKGKTWVLQEVALFALRAGLRVAFFSFEMNKKQCKTRLYQALLAELKRAPKDKEFIEVDIPKFVYDEDLEKYTIEYNKKKKYGLKQNKIKNKLKALKMHVRQGALRYVCPPAYSMSVKEMDDILDDMVLEGFVPDVIIADYADIIKPDNNKEYRHQIDSIWKGLKGLAQKKHCLVVTASHANKSTFEKDINESDVVEDSRKINHVSCMIAINQTSEEKKLNIARLNVLVNRHEHFNKQDTFLILQNLSIGKFMLDNKLIDDVEYKQKRKK